MSLHKSLKSRNELVRARNVLNRYERLLALRAKGLWKEEEDSILGLPKVRIFRVKKRPKVKEEKPEEGAAVEGAEGAVAEGAEGAEAKKEPEKIKRERAEKGEDEKAAREEKKKEKKEKKEK
jgi:small basic protein (TIGR04137 family)